MSRIEWAQFCELAFLDKFDRLCLIGITTQFTVPSLPIAVRQLMIAARIEGLRHGETIPIGVSETTPGGLTSAPESAGYEINVSSEYALITLWDIPFSEEGVHRFSVYAGDARPLTIEIAIRLVSKPQSTDTKKTGAQTNTLEEKARGSRGDVN